MDIVCPLVRCPVTQALQDCLDLGVMRDVRRAIYNDISIAGKPFNDIKVFYPADGAPDSGRGVPSSELGGLVLSPHQCLDFHIFAGGFAQQGIQDSPPDVSSRSKAVWYGQIGKELFEFTVELYEPVLTTQFAPWFS